MWKVAVAAILASSACGAEAPRKQIEMVFRLDIENLKPARRKGVVEETVATIKERINRFEIPTAEVVPAGDDRFTVRIPVANQGQLAAIKRLITSRGTLEFRITVEFDADNFAQYFELFQRRHDASDTGARIIHTEDLTKEDRKRHPLGLRWHRVAPDAALPEERAARDAAGAAWMLVAMDPHDVTAEALANVFAARDTSTIAGDTWAVYFDVKESAQAKMAKLTGENVEKYLAIILDDRVQSAPVLMSAITDRGQIAGNFKHDEARALAAALQPGALQHVPQLVSERVVER